MFFSAHTINSHRLIPVQAVVAFFACPYISASIKIGEETMLDICQYICQNNTWI